MLCELTISFVTLDNTNAGIDFSPAAHCNYEWDINLSHWSVSSPFTPQAQIELCINMYLFVKHRNPFWGEVDVKHSRAYYCSYHELTESSIETFTFSRLQQLHLYIIIMQSILIPEYLKRSWCNHLGIYSQILCLCARVNGKTFLAMCVLWKLFLGASQDMRHQKMHSCDTDRWLQKRTSSGSALQSPQLSLFLKNTTP